MRPRRAWGQGTYNGTITTSGSSFAADNKSIPVTMRVTDQPIGVPSTDLVHVRLAEGAPAAGAAITLANAGEGTLQISEAKTGGRGLDEGSGVHGRRLYPDGVALTLDPKGLTPGTL